MKKGSILFLIFCLLFNTAAYASTGSPGLLNRAYTEYVKANAALQEADSVIFDTVMGMTINIGDGEMSYNLTGTIAENHSDPANVQMKMDMTGIPGLEESLIMYYKDGFGYTEMMGTKIKTAMPVDKFMANSSVGADSFSFSSEDIKSQSIKEAAGGKKEITLVVDGTAMDSLPINEMAGVSVSNGLEVDISDVTVNAIIDAEGKIESLNMIFSADMLIQEIEASIDYDITLEVVQLGGVTIEFPADLDTYTDLETLTSTEE